MNVLLAWIGKTDLAAVGSGDQGPGPIARALQTGRFERALFLDDHAAGRTDAWQAWLRNTCDTPFVIRTVKLSGPTNYRDIYCGATEAVAAVRTEYGADVRLTFHLSPGTPAMAAVWLLLAKARYAAGLIESSLEQGVREVDVPFEISADYLPDLLRDSDARLARRALAPAPEKAQFGDIVYRSSVMERIVSDARKVAVRSISVLILGESGTGKELFARAIHDASPRRDKPFVSVNCGAIPANLVESELFGHERGAFTGALKARAGYFEQAHGGTLFLDEIGELPLQTQVQLLRVLQTGDLRRVGADKASKVDCRIIAATNRDLQADVAAGRFREDLYFRIAVWLLQLPPLRDRGSDLALLVDHLWQKVQRESHEDPTWTDKTMTLAARKLLLAHPWRGNVRELLNTLMRLTIGSDGLVVTDADVLAALHPVAKTAEETVLGRPLGAGLVLPELLAEVSRHYLRRAMLDSGGNKTKAAELVGAPSYQTFTNWLKKFGEPEGALSDDDA